MLPTTFRDVLEWEQKQPWNFWLILEASKNSSLTLTNWKVHSRRKWRKTCNKFVSQRFWQPSLQTSPSRWVGMICSARLPTRRLWWRSTKNWNFAPSFAASMEKPLPLLQIIRPVHLLHQLQNPISFLNPFPNPRWRLQNRTENLPSIFKKISAHLPTILTNIISLKPKRKHKNYAENYWHILLWLSTQRQLPSTLWTPNWWEWALLWKTELLGM